MLAASCEARYRVWLGVHGLILARPAPAASADGPAPSDEWLAEADRAERCRVAQVAAIVALQEVQATASVGAGVEA